MVTLTGAAPEPENPVPGTGTVPGTDVLLNDELPQGATPEGTWIWETAELSDGKLAHGHPPDKGLQSHGYSPEKPIPATANLMIIQEVWLDPADPPKGIALKLELSTGDEVGVYWEGEEEIFNPEEGQELWYYGPLPELGQWARMEILAEDMGLEEAQIKSIRFVTHGGRALWDKTLLTAAPPIEEADAILDQPVDVRPQMGNRDGSEKALPEPSLPVNGD